MIAAFASLGACGTANSTNHDQTSQGAEMAGRSANPFVLSVDALSRGKGVPEQTRDAFSGIRDLLIKLEKEGKAEIEERRLGIEGERRICAAFADRRIGRETLQELTKRLEGLELINLGEETCDR